MKYTKKQSTNRASSTGNPSVPAVEPLQAVQDLSGAREEPVSEHARAVPAPARGPGGHAYTGNLLREEASPGNGKFQELENKTELTFGVCN